MRIGGAALNQTPLDWQGNLLRIKSAIEAARRKKVDLLCLSELCITGYGCEDMFLHPWVTEKSLELLSKIVPETKDIGVAIGLPVRMNDKVYNTLAFVNNGEIAGFYVKQHSPNEGIHYEFRWFESWPSGVVEEIEIGGRRYPVGHITCAFNKKVIGFEICEDAWVVDRPACQIAEESDIILNTSASHFAFNKVKKRQEIIRKSSAEFNCVYVYANQLGNESGRVIYDGDILIAQDGEILTSARRLSFADYSLQSVEIDFDDSSKSERNLFDQITTKEEEFPQAVGLALFDYLRKSGSDGFVLSLSGGADSSTIAVLIAEMVKRGINELGGVPFVLKLGRNDNSIPELMKNLLTTAYQGTVNSSGETFESAKQLAESIGATFYDWKVDDEISSYQSKIETAVGRTLSWGEDDITLQNIQARSRSPIIWMLANMKNALLLATSNRSEASVGYATMDGDTSGSISPIAGVDKAFIREWLKYAEKELGYTALSHVNSLAPTAELRPQDQTQTDEDDLMPYEVLQKIESLFVKGQLSPEQISEKLKSEYPKDKLGDWIEKFFRLWKRNQWKRERYAPSFHLDDYNVDPRSGFRYPILSGE
ncbi:MAG: NAD(+) synthase [Cytophagales bacterium]|nr:NAD(+) synthase [Cytophagales bacterium]